MPKDVTTPQATERIWNRNFLLILIVNAMTGIASQMVTPLVSKYAISIGAPLTIAAAIASLMSISSLLCRPVSGAVTDMVNRKHLMMVASAVTALSVAGYSLASNVSVLVIMRTIHGISFSFMTVASMAFAAMYLPENKLGEGLGYLALGNILVQAVGPSLGLWLVDNVSYTACFIASAGFSLLGVIALSFVPYRKPATIVTDTNEFAPVKKRRFSLDSLIAKELIMYTVLIALFSCGNGLISTYLALVGDERGIENIAVFFTAYSLVLILVRPVSGKIFDKKGLSVILYPAYILFAIGMALIGAATKLWMIIVAGVLKSLGQGAGTPSIQAFCVKALGRERAGVASSTCLIGQDIGNAVAPIVGGFVAERFGYAPMFYGYAVLLAVFGCLLYFIQQRREKRHGKAAIM